MLRTNDVSSMNSRTVFVCVQCRTRITSSLDPRTWYSGAAAPSSRGLAELVQQPRRNRHLPSGSARRYSFRDVIGEELPHVLRGADERGDFLNVRHSLGVRQMKDLHNGRHYRPCDIRDSEFGPLAGFPADRELPEASQLHLIGRCTAPSALVKLKTRYWSGGSDVYAHRPETKRTAIGSDVSPAHEFSRYLLCSISGNSPVSSPMAGRYEHT